MKYRENDIKSVEEDNEQFVIADNRNPLAEALKKVSLAVSAERISVFDEKGKLGDKAAKSEAPAAELWRGMPEVAKEYEASRWDGGLRAKDAPAADDWEFDSFGAVTY